jgi:HAD superfamily hydrolase (TIGR01549 family)
MFLNMLGSLVCMVNIQVVVFDLFGTLLYLAKETSPYVKLFTNMDLQNPDEFRRAHRIAITEDFDDLAGLVRRIKPKTQIDTVSYEQEVEEEQASAQIYSETKKVLNKLKDQKIRMGLISNLASPYRAPFFNLGIDGYFEKILFSCDVGLRKTDPRIYKKIIQQFEVDPAYILMVGDKIHADVNGPISAGMNAVHLDRTGKSQGSISTLEGVFQYL